MTLCNAEGGLRALLNLVSTRVCLGNFFFSPPRHAQRTVETIMDNLEDSSIDDGTGILSQSWSGSTKVHILNERPLQGCSWVDVTLTKTRITSRPETCCQTCGRPCPNVLKRKHSSNGTWINAKYKLLVRGGKFTRFFPTRLKNLTPLFRTSERSWRCQWNQQCCALHKYASRLPRHRRTKLQCQKEGGRRPLLGNERRGTFSDEKRKANRSVRISKVYSSQRKRSFA